MSVSLNVFLYESLVGQLTLDAQRRFVFTYDSGWLSQTTAVPLSFSLPLQEASYEDDAARPFFANLLPESQVRDALARQLGISVQNDFAMLEAIGGECAGAVSLLPSEGTLNQQGEYRPLSDDELHQWISHLPQQPLLMGEGVRLSLAGAQNKLPVFIDNGQVYLPRGINPSSHILKPAISGLEGTVDNEAFCMQLAARIGLAVPEATLRLGQDRLYQVSRYDRQIESDGQIHRIHQEDFCQALAVPPDQKYEKEGGPSLAQCFSLIRQHSMQPLPDVKAMLEWVVFNYLIGNADAHAKNLSLLTPREGPRLAPFYDLLCTAVYPSLNEHLAMRIGGEDRPDWVIARKWLVFAEEVDIKSKLVFKTMDELSKSILKQSYLLQKDWVDQYGESKIVSGIIAVIEKKYRKVQSILEIDLPSLQ